MFVCKKKLFKCVCYRLPEFAGWSVPLFIVRMIKICFLYFTVLFDCRCWTDMCIMY